MSDNHDLLNDNDMCSFSGYEADDVCSNSDNDACRDGVFAVKKCPSLGGVAGFLGKYVHVFLCANNVIVLNLTTRG